MLCCSGQADEVGKVDICLISDGLWRETVADENAII